MDYEFVLLEVGTKEQLREYKDKEALFEDIMWKAPESFWIGVVAEQQAYTIGQIQEKYKDEYEKFLNNLE